MKSANFGSRAAPAGGEVLQLSFWLWVQQGADILLAFTFTWIAIRWLGPSSFGILNLIQATMNLAGLVAQNVEQVLLRDLPRFRDARLWNYAHLTWEITAASKLILVLFAALLLAGIAPVVAKFYGQSEFIVALRIGSLSVFSAALADLGAAVCLAYFRADLRAKVTILRRICELSGLAMFGLFPKSLGELTVIGAVFILAVADSVAAGVYLLAAITLIRRDPKGADSMVFDDQKPSLRSIFSYTLPLMGARISEVIGRELGKLLLGALADAAVVGYYSITRLLVERLTSLLAQAPLAAVPVLSTFLPGNRPSSINSVTEKIMRGLSVYQFMAVGAMTVGITVLAPIYIRLIGGDAFLPATAVVRSAGLLLMIWTLQAPLHTLYLAGNHTLGILYLNLTQIATALLCYFLLIPWLKAVGAGLADALSQLTVLGLGLWLAKRWFYFTLTPFVKDLILIAIPVVLLSLPYLFLGQNWLVLLLYIGIALNLYLTYLMAFGLLEVTLWRKLMQLDTHPAWIGTSIRQFAHILERYQYWARGSVLRLEHIIKGKE